MQLRDDVSSVSFKPLLSNCPVCHSKQQSALVEHGEGEEGGEEQTERIKLKRSLAGCFKPGKDSPKSYDVGVGGKVKHCRELFLQRQTQSVYLWLHPSSSRGGQSSQ